MIEAKHWNVGIVIDEHDGHTRATARLHTRDGDRWVGIGHARVSPADRDVPEIGVELAVARALADLAQHLLAATAADVGENTRDHGGRTGAQAPR